MSQNLSKFLEKEFLETCDEVLEGTTSRTYYWRLNGAYHNTSGPAIVTVFDNNEEVTELQFYEYGRSSYYEDYSDYDLYPSGKVKAKFRYETDPETHVYLTVSREGRPGRVRYNEEGEVIQEIWYETPNTMSRDNAPCKRHLEDDGTWTEMYRKNGRNVTNDLREAGYFDADEETKRFIWEML